MEIRKLSKKMNHPDIACHDIEIDWNISRRLNAKTVWNRAMDGNIACYQFVKRRRDIFQTDNPPKLYYGKVGVLGYIVADDEFEEERYGKPE